MTPNPAAVVNTLPEQPSVICDLGGSPQTCHGLHSLLSPITQNQHYPFNSETTKRSTGRNLDDCDFSDAIVNGVTVPLSIDCEFMLGDMETVVLRKFQQLIPTNLLFLC